MAIRPSSSKEIESLIADLANGNGLARDAAVARLTVIGARAVGRLVSLAKSTAPAAARVAAVRALDGIDDPRVLDAALGAIDDDDRDVAVAAVRAARRFLRGSRGAETVDRLTAVAVDQARPESLRLAAVRALNDLDPATIAPLVESLAADRSAAVRAEAASTRGLTKRAPADPAAELARIANGGLPDNALVLKDLLARGGVQAPLAALLRIVERVRDRESTEPMQRRADWVAARAAAHLALARRGSRLALYDLRESLERSAGPLPVDALAALSLIGDASCLEPIAAAHDRSTDEWWRDHLTQAFQEIAARERLTARHGVMKKISKRWPAFKIRRKIRARRLHEPVW